MASSSLWWIFFLVLLEETASPASATNYQYRYYRRICYRPHCYHGYHGQSVGYYTAGKRRVHRQSADEAAVVLKFPRSKHFGVVLLMYCFYISHLISLTFSRTAVEFLLLWKLLVWTSYLYLFSLHTVKHNSQVWSYLLQPGCLLDSVPGQTG